ncbi:hypothetical protein INS49_006252 [Diaporthe citri]|uniref:uncharacterized protein n=1 Tax=Diaporthe citri TaxID=83186 RepID=UPI001C7E63AA|nr:uncharacterized protein INS49_006252 [Diaporthe citri]KAG6364649.1 hypothetical protein INS49_006252 [Diaporthe citri]
MVSIGDVWSRPLAEPSQNLKHYYNILVAVAFFFVAQLLICVWDQSFWATGVEFPGQIVAMISVWLTVWAGQVLFSEAGEGVDGFYHRFLRAPTEILNKHMSIGFTVPFLNLISHSLANANQVGLLIAAFVATGVLNSIFVYVVAYHVQLTTAKITCCLRRRPVPDIEAARTQTNFACPEPPQRFAQRGSMRHGGGFANANLGNSTEEGSRRDRSQKHISDTSTLCTVSGYHVHLDNHHKKALTAVATLLNPVLWTSLFLVCYGLAKSSIRNQPSAVVIAGFTTRNTVSDLIAQHFDSPTPTAGNGPRLGSLPIGAGDVATSILNAGIVSWGLKLFEYRHQIVSSGGFTVVVTSLLASLLNVVVWPLLAYAIGVRPASWDLSFAARSVTIALGGPALKSLGGDAGINAVGVVVNGVCFQLVAGFFSGGDGLAAVAGRFKKALVHDGWSGLVWNSRVYEQREMESLAPSPDRGRAASEAHVGGGLQPSHEREVRYSSDATHVDEQRPDDQNDVSSWGTTGTAANNNDNMKMRTEPRQAHDGPQAHEDVAPGPLSVVPTVAAGVTIGINAAAMGTAHLYEQNSHAAPYSALSMTMFGVFTVLFALRGPMTEWLTRTVGGGEIEAAMML